MVALASAFPAEGPGMTVASWGGTAAIALMFFLQGARLAPQAALAGARHWRLHAVVLGSTFLVFPMLGLTMRAIAPGLLTPPLWGGLLMLCLLPSTVQSSIAFTSIARGNVAAALCAATASNLFGILLTPLLAGLLLSAHGGFSAHAVGDIVVQLLLPFAAGQLARPWIGAWVGRHKMLGTLVDRGSILLVVYVAFSEGMTHGIWHQLDAAAVGHAGAVGCGAAGCCAVGDERGEPAARASTGPIGSPSCSVARRRAWRAGCRWRACCSPGSRSGWWCCR